MDKTTCDITKEQNTKEQNTKEQNAHKKGDTNKEVNCRKVKKKKGIRLWIQLLWIAITNGYVIGFVEGKIFKGSSKQFCVPGLNCYSCPGATFSCPIGSLMATLNARQFHFAFYIVGFLMFFGSLFGRFVCGFLCPFGLVQDLLYKIPFPFKRKNMPGHKALKWLKYVVLVVVVFLMGSLISDATGLGQPWFCEYICPSGTLIAGIPLVAMNEGLQAAAGFRFALKLAILIVILLLSVVYYRPFCKYLCPLGALYGLFNPVAFYRFEVDKEKCVGCGACQKACRMDIPVYLKPNSLDCIRCGNCKRACPKGAIGRAKILPINSSKSSAVEKKNNQ